MIFSTVGSTGQHAQSIDTLLEGALAEMSDSDTELVGDKDVDEHDGDKEETSDKEKIDEGAEKQRDGDEEKKEEEKKKGQREKVLGEKRKRTSSANILVASFERIFEGASVRMAALLKAKRTRTTESMRSRAAKILRSEHYTSWASSDLEKALDHREDEGKADIFVSLEGDLREAWLKKKIASL
jgi:hypothetical protein